MPMTDTLSPGRARSLQATSTSRGIFTILAIDHRDALRVMIQPDAPEAVPAAHLTAVKLVIVRQLAPYASAVLLDPIYGAAQAIASGALPGHVGWLCALEEQGYLGDPFARQTMLLQDWSVEKAKRLGAAGVKILLFYHPEAGQATEKQEQFVREVLAQCQRYDLPLFLEPISYSLDPNVKKDGAEFARRRRRIVVESARRLGALRPDVLKVEFPIDARFGSDQALWREACAELNEAVGGPWALLSAGEPFETFKQQLRIACEAGAAGFLVGRAVWREAATLGDTAREAFLAQTAQRRLVELGEIAQELGKPWTARYALPPIDETWYRRY